MGASSTPAAEPNESVLPKGSENVLLMGSGSGVSVRRSGQWKGRQQPGLLGAVRDVRGQRPEAGPGVGLAGQGLELGDVDLRERDGLVVGAGQRQRDAVAREGGDQLGGVQREVERQPAGTTHGGGGGVGALGPGGGSLLTGGRGGVRPDR